MTSIEDKYTQLIHYAYQCVGEGRLGSRQCAPRKKELHDSHTYPIAHASSHFSILYIYIYTYMKKLRQGRTTSRG